ncbi:hypothetical protein FHU38_005399 [Saccharomonospora amisosensis]|uniref:Uncharacterized protein n=1 Tax=Saccharomonospora amisosensis TaxID=1128677 RepID=A0A7X5UVD9_9PSEU|nr:hypothetical protein [Saccharomonospora amisosensis]NIJ14991.1 hypothetical protein [Saccharomonospora amisosensis]
MISLPWHWHDDGQRHDLEHYELLPPGDDWRVQVCRARYWALTRDALTDYVASASFQNVRWLGPEASGFYQPLLLARRSRGTKPLVPQ